MYLYDKGENMDIQVFDKVYQIIYKNQITDDYEILQCKGVEDETEYTLLHIMDYEMIKDLLPILNVLQNSMLFQDYKGCFSKEKDLYVIFVRHNVTLLNDILKEEKLSIEKKLHIGKKILEKILLFNLPDFMICHVLSTDYIMFENGEVFFCYDWKELWKAEKSDMRMIHLQMKNLFEHIFQYEITLGMSSELGTLMQALEKEEFEDFFGIYEAYTSLSQVILGETQEYDKTEHTFFYKVSKALKKAEGVLQIVLFLFIYILIVWFLVETIKSAEQNEEPKIGIIYESIGTLKIR